MIEIKITNKIEDVVKAFIDKTGTSKTWIAKQMGYKSKQALDGALNSKNPTSETLELFAYFFNCDIKDLYEVEIIVDEESQLKTLNQNINSDIEK